MNTDDNTLADDVYEAAMGAADDHIVDGRYLCDHEYADALEAAGAALRAAAEQVRSKSWLVCDVEHGHTG